MNRKENILFVCRRLNIAGGKERVLVNTASFLTGDYNVAILQLTDAVSFYPVHPEVKMYNIEASNAFGKRSYISKLLGFIKDIREIRRFTKEQEVNIIISVDYFINLMFIISKFSGRKFKLVGWEHIGYDNPWLTGFSRRIKNFILGFSDHLVVLTNQDAEVYKKNGIKVTAIPNAKSFESNLKSSVTNRKILTIGRLSPQKGIDYFLDIIYLLKGKLENWKFVLIAQNDLFTVDELKKMIAEKEVGHLIEIHPPTHNIAAYYLDSSIYLMTSRNEGLPMVLIEAMECGLPCISFDCPTGPSDIIDNNYNGKLVEAFDMKGMVDSLLLLTGDDQLRTQMGINAAKSVEKFSVHKIKSRWQEFLNSINEMR